MKTIEVLGRTLQSLSDPTLSEDEFEWHLNERLQLILDLLESSDDDRGYVLVVGESGEYLKAWESINGRAFEETPDEFTLKVSSNEVRTDRLLVERFGA